MENLNDKVVTLAYLNIHGQSGFSSSKQRQIEDFAIKHSIDIINCQEINIDQDSFSSCTLISSNYNIIQNNAANKYGTAVLVKSEFCVDNIKQAGTCISCEDLSIHKDYLYVKRDGIV